MIDILGSNIMFFSEQIHLGGMEKTGFSRLFSDEG
jgi:hypothetical protein